jgi:hypothetical protein
MKVICKIDHHQGHRKGGNDPCCRRAQADFYGSVKKKKGDDQREQPSDDPAYIGGKLLPDHQKYNDRNGKQRQGDRQHHDDIPP